MRAQACAVKPGTTGPVQFSGQNREQRLLQDSEATVTILSGMTTYKMHASDYKSLVIIGQDSFPANGATFSYR